MGFSKTIKVPKRSAKEDRLGIIRRTQLNYCPIVWMFCSGQTNTMINKLHKRALRIALNDQIGNFGTLLAESSDICNHH